MALMAFLAASTHMYLALICGIVLLGICIRDIGESRKIVRAFLLITFITVLLITVYILGVFSSTGTSYEAVGLGYFGMNFNALYNRLVVIFNR